MTHLQNDTPLVSLSHHDTPIGEFVVHESESE